jgi:hypothetical protein
MIAVVANVVSKPSLITKTFDVKAIKKCNHKSHSYRYISIVTVGAMSDVNSSTF